MSPESIPPMNLTPAHGVRSGPLMELAEQMNQLTIRVDRIMQMNKLLKWVAMTAAAFALGSAFTVAKMLYGWGRDDAELRSDVRSLARELTEARAEQKELRSLVYSRDRHP